MNLSLTDFAAGRHFSADFAGTKLEGITPEAFIEAINKLPEQVLTAGYAPFCKHVFVENTWGVLSGVARITPENECTLQTEYHARREGELPVLTRYFAAGGMKPEVAPYLDLVLYSAEQLNKEGIEIDTEWGIVSINSCMSMREDPMKPITMLRNALGKEQGGSGHPLDPDAYALAVEYWSKWATVK